MGITAKPMGKLEGMFRKLDNEEIARKEKENKNGRNKKKEKTN